MKYFIYFFLIIVLFPYFTYAQFDNVNINKSLIEWKKSWDKKDIKGISNLLTEDYEYCSINSKWQNKSKRLSSIKSFFNKYKKVGLALETIKLGDSTSSQNDVKVIFKQYIVTEKTYDHSIVTMRFFKGEETNSIWKIYREIEDKPETINKATENNQPNSESGSWLSRCCWLIPIFILIAILIKLFNHYRIKKCRECGKAFAGIIFDSKPVGQEFRNEPTSNEYGGRAGEKIVVYDKFEDYYKCKYCGHKWKIGRAHV